MNKPLSLILVTVLLITILSVVSCGGKITETVTITQTSTVTTTLTVKLTDSINDYLSAILVLEDYAESVDIQYYPEGELVLVVLEKNDSRFDELLRILKECIQHKILPRYTTTIENGVTETLTRTIIYSGNPCLRFVLRNGDMMIFSLSDYLYYENDNAFYIATCNETDISDFLSNIIQ